MAEGICYCLFTDRHEDEGIVSTSNGEVLVLPWVLLNGEWVLDHSDRRTADNALFEYAKEGPISECEGTQS